MTANLVNLNFSKTTNEAKTLARRKFVRVVKFNECALREGPGGKTTIE